MDEQFDDLHFHDPALKELEENKFRRQTMDREKEARETVARGTSSKLLEGKECSLIELVESVKQNGEFKEAKGYLEGLKDERQKAQGLVKIVETIDNEIGGMIVFISGIGRTTIRESLKIREALANYEARKKEVGV